MASILNSDFIRSVLILLDEAYVGPDEQQGVWFLDNVPNGGFFGTLQDVSAQLASRSVVEGGSTIAAHTNHLRFSMELANRAFRGENAYANADWAGSWSIKRVSESEWKQLTASLHAEYEKLREAIQGGSNWSNFYMLTGALALVAHAAYHLGAIRQMVRALQAGA
jgi:hypothetical protein